ncbi:hypothetical protein [Citrobacter freundii]|uniref:hypothetical protein n=2 Tax=Citrobacter freundii complex TaxID=1344959 RepID=UPI0011B27692|nr:hypothetical protein [Citrobacter freundii]
MSTASEHYWAENYHLSLEEMNEEDAIQDVESMTHEDIDHKVNMRKYQEAYISDYLEYLWGISPKSFWAHILVMFSGEEGLLISDNMKFASILCNEVAPKEVVTAIVKYTIDADSQRFTGSLDEDILSEIIQEQNKLGEKEIDLCDVYGGDVNEELKEKFSVVLNRNIDNAYKNW